MLFKALIEAVTLYLVQKSENGLYLVVVLRLHVFPGAVMAKNTGKDYRVGSVDNRSQVRNPRTQQWVKRDDETGRFVGQKGDGTPYKGVAKERDGRKR